MKKVILLSSIAAMTVLYSCKSDKDDSNGEFTQEQVDSMMQAKEDSINAALANESDSLLKAAAEAKADSINIADSLAKITAEKNSAAAAAAASTTKPKRPKRPSRNNASSKNTTPPAPAEAPKKKGGLRGSSDQASKNTGGLRSKSDQVKAKAAKSQGGGLRNKSDQAKSN